MSDGMELSNGTKVIGVYGLSNVAAVCVHEIDDADDQVLASINGEGAAWYPMEDCENEDGEYEPGFLFGEMFIPFSMVMRLNYPET